MTSHTGQTPGASPATLIVGLGKTGLACARFCQRQGIAYAVVDSRDDPPALEPLRSIDASAKVYLGGFDEDMLAGVERLIVSPGVSLKESFIQQAMARNIEVMGDIELFARHADAPVVAIAGSNGKSTVTTLVGEMARTAGMQVKVGGNLGTPAIELLCDSLQSGQVPDFYILELSSFQLEATHSLNAMAAVVLNVSPDHMDRYASFAEYAAAKQAVYQGDGVMVVNKDDATVMAMMLDETGKSPARRVLRFGLRQPGVNEFGLHKVNDQEYLAHGDKDLLPVSELKIPGRHNQANALAALALGHALQLPLLAMLEALRSFPGLPHRTQWVAAINDVSWYNDSKGTNVGATISAIKGMAGPKLLIAGGDGKGADFTPLRDAMVNHDVRHVVLIGVDADRIASALQGSVNTIKAASMEDAVAKACELARPGDSVLLSPACASFDMFDNYEHRGECFIHAVQTLHKADTHEL